MSRIAARRETTPDEQRNECEGDASQKPPHSNTFLTIERLSERSCARLIRAGLISMKRTMIASFGVVLLAALAHGAERDSRFAKRLRIPGLPGVVVVAEGDFEPRSVGSYALRLYGGSSKQSSTDDFVVGLIRPRNGTVEAVRFDDIDGDDRPEIVVIIRAAGSGGYVSADAFRYRKGSLDWVASVTALDKGADPIPALRGKLKVLNGRNGSLKTDRRASGR